MGNKYSVNKHYLSGNTVVFLNKIETESLDKCECGTVVSDIINERKLCHVCFLQFCKLLNPHTVVNHNPVFNL